MIKNKPSEMMVWKKYYNEEAKNIEFPKTTVYNLVYDINKNNKDSIAISYGDNDICYGQFFDKVEEVKESLKNKVKPGEIITVASLNTPELIYLFYALGELHAITNMIDPRTSYQGILDYIKEADSSKLLVINLFNDKLKEITKDSNVNEIINVSLRNSAKKLPFKVSLISILTDIKKELQYRDEHHIDFEDYLKKEGNIDNSLYDYNYKEDLPLTIVHTGGTTGVPKGVLLSHDGYNAMAWQYKYSGINLQAHHSFMNMMPPFLAYGSDMFHMPFVIGMKVVLVPLFDANKFDQLIHKYKPNHFAGVPNHMMNLTKSKLLNNKDLSYIITAASGGDGITCQNHQKANEFLINRGAKNGVSSGYALSEVNSIFSVCVNENVKYGSAGFPVPGANVGIFDENNNELGFNEIGQICINTPTQMIGYYENEAETEKVLKIHNDGKTWVHTGDLGYIDEDGFVWITDRIKNVIVRFDGFKLYPSKIEEVINSHYAVENSKVVGIIDCNYDQGELPMAYIKLKPEYVEIESKILADIKNICESRLPEYFLPVDYKIKDSFPLTPIGKVDVMRLKNEDINKKVLIKSKKY
ncbi:MAG: class I adenylate-forming enzyme family protein [Bacilli bacterium]|nr:class I adenylate-forming enzyme family protein [Bacilli bacterium]